MRNVRIEGLKLYPDEKEERLKKLIARIFHLKREQVLSVEIVRRSLDARRHRRPFFVYVVDVELSEEVSLPREIPSGLKVYGRPPEKVVPTIISLKRKIKPIIIGSGPAGLFAALTFTRHGLPVVLLERGKQVPERVADVEAFWTRGILNPESNVQFGEGGAGTFSDGKLTSRSKDPLARWVKQVFVKLGAPERILIEAKPHIGTDLLRRIMVNFREHLEKEGGEVRFNSTVTDFLCSRGRVQGCIVNEKEEVTGDCVILAIGQSAEDTYECLKHKGVMLAPKPFAMGVRIEHPQELINGMQYGRWKDALGLPPADYFLSARLDEDRSIYTFCMCPGGRVIGASNHPARVLTNGMSLSSRDGLYANCALVISVKISDFYRSSPLDGIAFRRLWEEKAFLAAGGNYFAPAEGVLSFLEHRTSPAVRTTTFLPGVRAVSLGEVMPSFTAQALREGLTLLRKKVPAFVSQEASLIGIESRTSAPIRILRGEDRQSVSLKGLYPCGEGAGYAGGIISSALDGIKAAMAALQAEGVSIPPP